MQAGEKLEQLISPLLFLKRLLNNKKMFELFDVIIAEVIV
jgi:hypothetical protein